MMRFTTPLSLAIALLFLSGCADSNNQPAVDQTDNSEVTQVADESTDTSEPVTPSAADATPAPSGDGASENIAANQLQETEQSAAETEPSAEETEPSAEEKEQTPAAAGSPPDISKRYIYTKDALGGLQVEIQRDEYILTITEPGAIVSTLTFSDPCKLRLLLEDKTLVAEKEGITAKDEEGNAWISRKVKLDDQDVFAFFPQE